jgi:hypothetical protein
MSEATYPTASHVRLARELIYHLGELLAGYELFDNMRRDLKATGTAHADLALRAVSGARGSVYGGLTSLRIITIQPHSKYAAPICWIPPSRPIAKSASLLLFSIAARARF